MRVLCENCSVEFERKPSQISKVNRVFCSRKCAISYNNRKHPKRKKTKTICGDCGGSKSYGSARCQSCKNRKVFIEVGNSPISNYFLGKKSASRAKYNPIRKWARNSMEYWNIKKECFVCRFSTYVEVCHKIGIATFEETALMKEVNSKDNLIYLCPNHHILYDMGLLSL